MPSVFGEFLQGTIRILIFITRTWALVWRESIGNLRGQLSSSLLFVLGHPPLGDGGWRRLTATHPSSLILIIAAEALIGTCFASFCNGKIDKITLYLIYYWLARIGYHSVGKPAKKSLMIPKLKNETIQGIFKHCEMVMETRLISFENDVIFLVFECWKHAHFKSMYHVLYDSYF